MPTLGSLTWTAGPGGAADSFVVYLSTNNPPTDVRLGSVTGALRTIPYAWLTPFTNYYWTVTAYNAADSAKPISAWSFTTGPESALSGVYTINAPGGGPRDFPSFSAAANTVNTYGISDTVVIEAYAVSGDYYEQVNIKTFVGPPGKWVKFRAAEGESVRVHYGVAWNTGVIQNSGNAVNYKFENLIIECVSGQGNASVHQRHVPGLDRAQLPAHQQLCQRLSRVQGREHGDRRHDCQQLDFRGHGRRHQCAGRDLLLRGQRHHEYRDRGLQRHHHQRRGRDVRQQRDYGCLVQRPGHEHQQLVWRVQPVLQQHPP